MHFSIDVKDGTGAVVQWRFEGYPPNMLVRQGWKRDVTLKHGMVVTVTGWQARIEPNLGAAREVVDVTGFNEKTWLLGVGTIHSDKLRVTERYTRDTIDTITYEVTMEDPVVFTKPWKTAEVFRLRPGRAHP